jgi:hypothetical protein
LTLDILNFRILYCPRTSSGIPLSVVAVTSRVAGFRGLEPEDAVLPISSDGESRSSSPSLLASLSLPLVAQDSVEGNSMAKLLIHYAIQNYMCPK